MGSPPSHQKRTVSSGFQSMGACTVKVQLTCYADHAGQTARYPYNSAATEVTKPGGLNVQAGKSIAMAEACGLICQDEEWSEGAEIMA